MPSVRPIPARNACPEYSGSACATSSGMPAPRRRSTGITIGVCRQGCDRLSQLPVLDKPTLMSNFDDWVTDPDVTLEDLRRDFLPRGTGRRLALSGPLPRHDNLRNHRRAGRGPAGPAVLAGLQHPRPHPAPARRAEDRPRRARPTGGSETRLCSRPEVTSELWHWPRRPRDQSISGRSDKSAPSCARSTNWSRS